MYSFFYLCKLLGFSIALIIEAKIFLEISMLFLRLRKRRKDVCILIILFLAISYIPIAVIWFEILSPDQTAFIQITSGVPVIFLVAFMVWQMSLNKNAIDGYNKENGNENETLADEIEVGAFRKLINALPIVNDFWFLTKENKEIPYDSEVDQRCRSRYQGEWFMHPILWIFAFLVWWPLGVLVLLVYFIRRTKYAHYNHKLYEAEFERKQFDAPSDSRLALYITASFIVAAGYYAYQFSRVAFNYISLLVGS